MVPDAPADPFFGGKLCSASVAVAGVTLGSVSGQRVFAEILCTARVEIFASVAPQSSLLGPLPANWSNACSGPALGTPCVLNGLGTDRVVGLTCDFR